MMSCPVLVLEYERGPFDDTYAAFRLENDNRLVTTHQKHQKHDVVCRTCAGE
jgi:hypothetical protein